MVEYILLIITICEVYQKRIHTAYLEWGTSGFSFDNPLWMVVMMMVYLHYTA